MSGRPFYGNQHTQGDGYDYSYDNLVEDVIDLGKEIERTPTTADAETDSRLPSISTVYKLLADRSWNELLADAELGQTQVGEYGPEERPEILAAIRRVFEDTTSKHLTVREYSEHSHYNKSVVKRLFGTWNHACDAANVPHGIKHGSNCQGPKGNVLESRFELVVAVALDERNIEYIPHRPIPDTRWRCDFYLPRFSLWVAVDGYISYECPNRDSFENKLWHYEREKMRYIVIDNWDKLEKKVFQRS